MTMGKYYRVNYHISLPYKINLNENENFHNIFTYHYGLDSFVNTADPIVYFSDDSYPVYNNIGVKTNFYSFILFINLNLLLKLF